MGISGFPGVHPGWAQYRALGAASLECCAVAEGVLDAYLVVGAQHPLQLGLPGGAAHLPRGRRGRRRARGQGSDRPRGVDPTANCGGHESVGRPAAGGKGPVREDDRVDGAEAAGALLARKTWRTLEPLHGMVYFVPEAAEAYARLGITGRAGYFASRAAPMGAVTADVVVSTFFNFNPELVHAAIPAAWQLATPVALVTARFTAVDAAFRRLLGMRSCRRTRWAGPPSWRGTPPRRPAGGWRVDRWLPPTPTSRGLTLRTWCSGTPSRSCASTAATATSRSSSCGVCPASRPWSPTRRRVMCRSTCCARHGAGPQDAWDGAVDALRVARLVGAG